ncbi:leukotriene-B4 omega-hydroxylase 3-like [Glandiceps talaboti]
MIASSVFELFESTTNAGFWFEFSKQWSPRWEVITVIFVFIVMLAIIQLSLTVIKLFKMRWAAEEAFKAFPTVDIYRSPIFGHLELVNVNREETMQIGTDIPQEFPHALPLWLGPFHCVLLCHHPSTVQPILSSTEPKNDFLYGFVKPWLGDGLLISKGKKWMRNRKLLSPGFHFDILRPYIKVFNESTKTMLHKWDSLCQDGSLEMFSNISLMTLDSLLKCIFSQESHCQTQRNTNPYIKSVYELSDLIMERVNNPFYYSDTIYNMTHKGYQWRKALNDVHGHSKKVIKDRRQALRDGRETEIHNKRKYVDFLDILLAAKDEDGKGLTDQEIRDEVDTFMFEGHDTTASAISWCLYNLARHPEYQQKCRDEVDQLLDSKETDEIEWDDLGKIPFLTMCLKESMRLHPIVPFIARQNINPVKFPEQNVTIPPGHLLGISIIGLHHHPEIWDDPMTYDPYRFLPENSRGRPTYAYVPFSAGPRNCIGQHFAMDEMKICLSLVLRKFVLSVDDQTPVRRLFNVVLRAEDGLHINVAPRK